MADLKENQMTQSTSPTYIRGVDSAGNSCLVPIDNLRSLIFRNGHIMDNVDANELLDTGIYYLRTGIQNAVDWCLLEVLNFGWNTSVIQYRTDLGGWTHYIRVREGDNEWQDWRKLF